MYVLEDLWKGKEINGDKLVRSNSRYEKVFHQTVKLVDEFCKELSPEGAKAFEDYQTATVELRDIAELDSFIRGVRFGAQFILDVLGEYRSQLPLVDECKRS